MRCRPTLIAPELTSTTLCPAACRCTTVSTMVDSVERSGSWVSCTIEDVPAPSSRSYYRKEVGKDESMGCHASHSRRKMLDHYGERLSVNHTEPVWRQMNSAQERVRSSSE